MKAFVDGNKVGLVNDDFINIQESDVVWVDRVDVTEMKTEKVEVEDRLLREAWIRGNELNKEYKGRSATDNRAMELAFLSGLLGFDFDQTKIAQETLR